MVSPERAEERKTRWWKGRPWRLIQTNLREIDMRDIDASRYVEELRRFGATVAMVNTSGIIASYPTELEFHTPSAFLQGDSLSSIIDACHAADINVIARMDFSKVRRPLYELHPEWAYIGSDGGIVDENGDVHVCICGEYQQDLAPRVVEETITMLDVDGVYFNWSGFMTRDYAGIDHGICRCASCRSRFDQMFELPLPEKEDMADPAYRRYLVFKERTLRAHREGLHALIRRRRPELLIDRSFAPDAGFVRQESASALDHPNAGWPYSASANTKWVVSSFPGVVSSNSSVDFIDFPVRHVAVSPHEQRLRMAQALANGGGLDYYVIGRLDERADRSGFAGVRELFRFHAEHEDDYRDLRSCAQVALLTGPGANLEEFRGWFRILTENHFLFDVVLVEVADEALLARYHAVLLTDHEPLSAESARRIDAFVERGGTLVASGRVGLRDESYEPREIPPLKCLGIEQVRAVREDTRGSYFEIDDREGFGRLQDTRLVFLDGPYVEAGYAAEVRRRLRLVPPGPFGPPERCYNDPAGDEPGLTLNTFGRGRTVYVPWLCGALFYRNGQPNTGRFVADVLEHHAGLAPLGGDLAAMVEATLLERAGGDHRLLQLVNGSGHFGIGYEAPVPMRDLEVTIPQDGRPIEVFGLVSGNALPWTHDGSRLTLRVPELGLLEAIRIKGRWDA